MKLERIVGAKELLYQLLYYKITPNVPNLTFILRHIAARGCYREAATERLLQMPLQRDYYIG